MNAAHLFLREATASYHAKVDAAFGSFDLSNLIEYTRFLRAQAGAYLPIEEAIEQAGVANVLDDWQERKRGHALIADLESLGSTAPSPLVAPILDSEAALWGALYVIEGSRLGGRTLAPAVAANAPTRFLDHRLEKGAWRKLLERLSTNLLSDHDQRVAASTAQAVFELFETSAKAANKV
jgi:heme oxygenase